MNVRFLIDRLVQAQAGLLAELATSGGVRAPLAELADQTFVHLAEELDRRGISRKVSADMFGMAQRAYLKKLQRLAKSSTEKGASLWQAVVFYLDKQGGASRAEVMQRFCRDDESQLRAVLFDLCESGLATMQGSGPAAHYSLARLEAGRLDDSENFSDLVWLTIFREGPLSRDSLLENAAHRQGQVDAALASLVDTGRIVLIQSAEGVSYVSTKFEIAPGQDSGWEAAILDHYQAMVRTVLEVLPGLTGTGETPSSAGGYTYSLDVWPGHPHEEEVAGTLNELRSRLSSLRKRVDDYNERVTPPSVHQEYRVYGGQSMAEREHLVESVRPSS